MSIDKEFSKHAGDYNSYNIIQQIIAKSLVREISGKPRRILELGCGSGQIFKHIDWDLEFYKAVDFSKSMCELHPKAKNLEVCCFDFDSNEFFENIKDDYYDMVLSASALQWSKDLGKTVRYLQLVSKEINAVLFTSNTFKTIQRITRKKSPILDIRSIKDAFLQNGEYEFEVLNYNLEFDNKKELFDYIKNSGVSGGGEMLSFKDAKRLYKEYKLNYLEFEVIFVKSVSKS